MCGAEPKLSDAICVTVLEYIKRYFIDKCTDKTHFFGNNSIINIVFSDRSLINSNQ